ncbi:MAG: NAD(+) diphosphatase [Treponema sp.]|uniref:NAD(+) diphosphatase n=1 Tax=Treponema sp. TaxID=166 RepID=UPI0025D3275A|nr:NAD(+) diphosphatase [Treponema sp.]MBR0494879.1 NAD(+) diphosphatase [Treponema sp.]
MPMISNQMNVFCEIHFIFREKSIILQGDSLPDEQVVRKCLSMNVAEDWFAELEYGYSAILLEKDTPNPAGCTDIPLREFFHKMRGIDRIDRFVSFTDETKKVSGAELAGLAARARGLLNFKHDKRYCQKCGGFLRDDLYFTARTCPRCKTLYFPQLEPAIITLVSRGDEILLARHKNRNDDVYSCIAGFVEVGETIENAVQREVLEETGINVKNIRYVGSQSWPFPDQLMLAFRAEYESGEIKIQEEELLDANWFKWDELPKVPGPGSVAYNLIHGEFE